MSDQKQEIEAVLRRVEETLQAANHGFSDLTGRDRARRFSGLRNLIVFGRSVTFVLQNLRSVMPEGQFDLWYGPKQEEMKQDPLMRYFVEARNEILKQGKLNVFTSATINVSSEDIQKLGTPPPGAVSFFIGDQLGGSGWVVELRDGSTEKYYVELPVRIVDAKQHFAGLSEMNDPGLKGRTIEELCALYLQRLGELVDDARRHFLREKAERVSGRRPSHLRIIK